FDARSENLFFGENPIVNARFAFHDFAGGKIAVFLRLDECVLVHRLAEVAEVVGADLLIISGGILIFVQLSRSSGEAKMNCVRISFEDLRPLTPCGTMALVNNDDAEGVRAVVLRKKTSEVLTFRLVINAKSLIGGYVDSGILRGVFAVLGFNNSGVVAKCRM